jgi:hypothetical protein
MKYRIFISHGSDITEVKQPLGKVSLSKEKSSNDYGGYYWESKLSSFTIQRKLDSAAYDLLMSIENSVYRCDPVYVELRRYVDTFNNQYNIEFRGEFSMNSCKFNIEHCKIEVSCREVSLYSCLNKNKDADYNFLSIENPITGSVFRISNLLPFNMVGAVEYSSDDMSGDPTWDNLTLPGIIGGVPGSTTIYFRLYVVTECIGNVSQTPDAGYGQTPEDWIPLLECFTLGDGSQYTKWVMYPPTYVGQYIVSQLSYIDTCPVTTAIGQITISGTCCSLVFTEGTPGYAVSTIPNGRSLYKTILAVTSFALTDCPYSISFAKSDFFLFNSDLVETTYNQVSGGLHYWKHPLLFQITDVKFPEASEQASIGMITFKKLMSDLYKMFKVVWWLESDGSNYWVRVEHESFAESLDVINLSNLKGFKAYNYLNENLPYSLKFSTPVQRNLDFVGSEIKFSPNCTNQEIESRNTDMLCADIDYIQSFPDNITNDAIVIVAADADGNIWSTTGMLSNNSQVNAPMSWANLHDAFHRHGAHTPSGKLNNVDVDFVSTKRIKRQSLTAKNCDLYLHSFTMCETELGIGEINSITTEIHSCVSQIDVTL